MERSGAPVLCHGQRTSRFTHFGIVRLVDATGRLAVDLWGQICAHPLTPFGRATVQGDAWGPRIYCTVGLHGNLGGGALHARQGVIRWGVWWMFPCSLHLDCCTLIWGEGRSIRCMCRTAPHCAIDICVAPTETWVWVRNSDCSYVVRDDCAGHGGLGGDWAMGRRRLHALGPPSMHRASASEQRWWAVLKAGCTCKPACRPVASRAAALLPRASCAGGWRGWLA